jgi:hypothetical protein
MVDRVLVTDDTFLLPPDVQATQDARYASKGVSTTNARDTGAAMDGVADDTAEIQAALNTGNDVEITNGTVKITGRLNMVSPGQRLTTRNATIKPAHLGDCILITQVHQAVSVTIGADLQPSSGDFSQVAAIRIGGPYGTSGAVYNPKNASVAGSRIIGPAAFKGNGVIWEQGAHIDFSRFSIEYQVTYDGVRGTPDYDDNNEGFFANCRVSNCGRHGYWFQNNATDATKSSRAHTFANAKSFGAGAIQAGGANFYIETGYNVGNIFSELGANPDNFTATSLVNNIEYTATNSNYANVVDSGTGNRLSGWNSFGKWDTKRMLMQAADINTLHAGRLSLTQPADNAFLDTVLDTNNNTTVTHNHGGTGVRTDAFSGTGAVTVGTGGVSTTGTLSASLGLSVSGSVRYNNSTRTASYSQPSNGSAYNLCDATAGPIVVSLPGSGVANGTVFFYKKIDNSSNIVTISNGTIDGASSFVLDRRYEYVTLQAGAAGIWYIIALDPTSKLQTPSTYPLFA